jgi:hypothetical protein
VLVSHWIACLISLQAALHESPQQTWLGPGRYEYCRAGVRAEPSATNLKDCPSLDLGTYYLAAITWALLVVTGMGGTDFYPSSPQLGGSSVETLIVMIISTSAALFWTMVTAQILDVVVNGDPGETHYRQARPPTPRLAHAPPRPHHVLCSGYLSPSPVHHLAHARLCSSVAPVSLHPQSSP